MGMSTASLPLVSVVTAVHNGERYLEECIESVLNQTYEHWEYLIVNNCSNDSTREIAERYARSDGRIHVHNYDAFVGVIDSHRRALALISPHSKYCKILPADDGLLPECLARMVEFAESHPSVGIVGAYTLRGSDTRWRVVFDGVPYNQTIVPGPEACRHHLLGGNHFFGIPTSVLYQAAFVRKPTFYPNSRSHADISIFYECLHDKGLGFIHQVLTFERVHQEALTADAKRLSSYAGSHLLDVHEYGPLYLTKDELAKRLVDLERDYYRLLANGVVHLEGKRFWKYHTRVLQECGSQLNVAKLSRAVFLQLVDLLGNPKLTLKKALRHWQSYRLTREASRA